MTTISSRGRLLLMASLNDRQIKILKSLIEEYIETAMPVGSETLEKKFSLGISPATIRNEMVRLTNDGFLKKSHSSAGRTPTPMALKYYVGNIMKEQNLSLAEEVAVKEKVWDYRNEVERLLREATKELALRTKEMAVAATDKGDVYTAGMGNILEAPEFFDIDLTKAILFQLDENIFWKNIIESSWNEDPVSLLLGSDLGNVLFEPCSFVFSRFKIGPRIGAIGVIGPARLNFSRVFPTIRYFGELIDEVFRGW